MTGAEDREDSEPGPGEPTVGRVAVRLALYVLPGAAAAMVVWEVFSELLSGQLPSGDLVWLAATLLVVLVLAVAALRRDVLSRR